MERIYNEKTIKHFLKTKFSKEELIKILCDCTQIIDMKDNQRGTIHISGVQQFDLGGWTEKSEKFFKK